MCFVLFKYIVHVSLIEKREDMWETSKRGPSRPLLRGRGAEQQGAVLQHCRYAPFHRRSLRRCAYRSCQTPRQALRPRGLCENYRLGLSMYVYHNENTDIRMISI